MNRILTILVVMLLAGSVWPADVIEMNRAFSTGNRTYCQGIPREWGSCRITDSGGVVMAQSSAGYAGIACFRSYTDHWQTLVDSAFIGNIMGDHSHSTLRHDTVIVVGPRSDATRNGKIVVRFTVVNGDIVFVDSTIVDSAGTTVADSQGEIEWVPNKDSVILLGRNPDAMDVWSWLSQDNGATFASTGLMYNYNMDTRVEIDTWGDSLYAVVFDGVTPFAYYFHPFDGSTWGTRATIVSGWTNQTRLFTATEGRDGWVHVLWSDYASPSHVIHARRDPNGGAWALDTPFTAPGAILENGGELWTAITFSEWDAKVRAFYTTTAGDSADCLVKRIWNYATASWSAPDTLSSDGVDFVNNLSSCRTVPSNHHSRAYIQFNERISGTFTTRHMTIADSAATQYGVERNKVMIR